MKLGTLSRIRREDLSGAPPWADKLIDVLNPFIEQIVTAFQRRITFVDNIQSKVIFQEFTDNIEQIVSVPSGSRVSGAIAVYAVNDVIKGVGVSLKQDQNVGITLRLQSTGKTNCRVIIFLEG